MLQWFEPGVTELLGKMGVSEGAVIMRKGQTWHFLPSSFFSSSFPFLPLPFISFSPFLHLVCPVASSLQ